MLKNVVCTQKTFRKFVVSFKRNMTTTTTTFLPLSRSLDQVPTLVLVESSFGVLLKQRMPLQKFDQWVVFVYVVVVVVVVFVFVVVVVGDVG